MGSLQWLSRAWVSAAVSLPTGLYLCALSFPVFSFFLLAPSLQRYTVSSVLNLLPQFYYIPYSNRLSVPTAAAFLSVFRTNTTYCGPGTPLAPYHTSLFVISTSHFQQHVVKRYVSSSSPYRRRLYRSQNWNE